MRLFLATIILLSTTLSGCSTIHTLKDRYPRNKIYSGTIANFSNSWTFMHIGIVDWPFSLIADTVLLPYTIPKTITNYLEPDGKWKPASDIPEDLLFTLSTGQSLVSVQELLGRPDPYTFYCPGLPVVRLDALRYHLVSGASASLVFDENDGLLTVFALSGKQPRSYILGQDPCT